MVVAEGRADPQIPVEFALPVTRQVRVKNKLFLSPVSSIRLSHGLVIFPPLLCKMQNLMMKYVRIFWTGKVAPLSFEIVISSCTLF